MAVVDLLKPFGLQSKGSGGSNLGLATSVLKIGYLLLQVAICLKY